MCRVPTSFKNNESISSDDLDNLWSRCNQYFEKSPFFTYAQNMILLCFALFCFVLIIDMQDSPKHWVDENVARSAYKTASDRDDHVASFCLANSLNQYFQEVKPNDRLSYQLYEKASSVQHSVNQRLLQLSESGDADATFNLALFHLRQKSDDLGIRLLQQAHSMGHLRATLVLANTTEEFELYRVAAQGGNPTAMVRHAYFNCFTKGHVEEGMTWYWKAVDQDYCQAMLDLARFYQQGKYVPNDWQISKYLYNRAASLKCHHALLYLAEECHDDVQSVKYLEVAVESATTANEYSAHVLLSKYFIEGSGVTRDITKAIKLLLHAFCEGVPDSTSVFTQLIQLTESHPQDAIKGLREYVLRGNSVATSILQDHSGEQGRDFVSSVEKSRHMKTVRGVLDTHNEEHINATLQQHTVVTEADAVQVMTIQQLNKDCFDELLAYLM
jgi:TPR repeat protein